MSNRKKPGSHTPNSPANRVLESHSALADEPFGVKVLFDGTEPVIDLIAVHGLDGHQERTWTAENGNSWLRDYLPHVVPNVRILAYGFDGRTRGSSSTPLSCQKLHDHAISLITELTLFRKVTKTTERAIIFIAHSIGGIIVKDALIHSNSANRTNLEDHNAIKTSTYGILFFGTPHQGTDIITWTRSLIDTTSLKNKNLEKGSELLQKQLGQYNHISNDFVTKFFYEAYKSSSSKALVVTPSCAIVPGATDAEVFSINSSHEGMVKFKSADNGDFIKVSSCLQLMTEAAPEKISDNWSRWRRMKAAEDNGIQLTFNIPFEPEHLKNTIFTGREDILQRLHGEITKDESVLAIVILYGVGGIGKTQIVSEYLHTHQKEYQSIFWVNAATKETLELGFRTVAQRLIREHAKVAHDTKPDYLLIAKSLDMLSAVDENGSISSQEEHTECIIRGVKLWFAKEENRNWLLIFDNVDDLEKVPVRAFIPTVTTHGKVIMTSRRPECAFFGTGIEVTEMSDEEGRSLLLKSARIEDSPIVEEAATKLGCLPLAIVQAGAYVAVRRISLRRYLDIYDTCFSEISSEKPPDAVWAYGDRTVWTTWEISFRAIKDESKEAAELLSLCSFLFNENIREDMLRYGKQLTEKDTVLGNSLALLFSYSLAQRKGLNNSFYIHPVVHLWASERLAIHERIGKTKEAVLLIARAREHHSLVPRTEESYEYENRIIEHIEATSVNIKKYLKAGLTDTSVISAISSLAGVLFDKGRWREAEELQLRAGGAGQRIEGKDHPNSLTRMINLSGVYLRQGRWKEAEQLLLQCKQSKEHPDSLPAISNLAIVYLYQGRWQEAEEMQLQVVEAKKKSLGIEHPDTILAVTNLAVTYWNQGRWSEAEKLQLSAVDSRRRILGERHPDTIGVMDHLAVTYLSQGRLKEAEELQLLVVESRENLFGKGHPETLTSISNLARIYMSEGRLSEAEELELQVVEERKRSMGEEHPETLGSISNLAVTYWKQGRFKEAEELKLHVMQVNERIHGKEHPDTLQVMDNLAVTYSAQGRLNEAEELLQRVVKARERLLSKEHPLAIASMSNLAALYTKTGRWKEAEELGRKVVETSRSSLGEQHPETLRAISNLAVAHRGQGRSEAGEMLNLQVTGSKGSHSINQQSTSITEDQRLPDQSGDLESREIEEEMLQRAIEMSINSDILEQGSGEEDPATLIALNNQLFAYFGQDRWEEAEALGLQILEARKRTLGDEHPDTLTSMANLAFTYLGQKRWKEAGEVGLQVVEARKRILGDEHPDTLLAMTNLGGAYLSQERIEEAEELASHVVDVKMRTQGSEHPDTRSAITNLNTVRQRLRKKTPASTGSEAEMLERAIALSLAPSHGKESGEGRDEHPPGKSSPDTLKIMANQGATYWDLGYWEQAAKLELRVMKARRIILGKEHRRTLIVMANLAATYRELERFKEAEELELQVLEVRRRTQGTEHPDTLIAMTNLAGTYTNQGRWKEAENLQVQVMEARQKILGENHRSTLSAMASLGANYWQQWELKKAEELELQVMEGRQRALGREHRDTLTAMGNLAATYASQGRLKDAEILQQRALEISSRTLGAHHSDTISAQELLQVYTQLEIVPEEISESRGQGSSDRGPNKGRPEYRESRYKQGLKSQCLKYLPICVSLLFFTMLFLFFEHEHASEMNFGEYNGCIRSENIGL